MKFWLKSSLSIVIGIMILLAGSGFSLAKMVCLKSGYTQISLNEPDDCCKHEHEHAPVTIEEKCCDISNISIEVFQYLNSATQTVQKSFASAVFFSPNGLSVQSTSTVSTNQCSGPALPPDIDEPPIRILTKSFLI